MFYDATYFFSHDAPLLSEVILAIDITDKTLTNYSLDDELEPVIRAAVNLAKKTINRYYKKTDDSECNRIAMSTYMICLLYNYTYLIFMPRLKS